MKSVGEAMGIGRTFTEAFLKAMRSRELDRGAATPWATLDDLPADIHPWFRAADRGRPRCALCLTSRIDELTAGRLLYLKELGWSDAAIAEQHGATEEFLRLARQASGIRPAYRRVDSCAAEVEAELELPLLDLGRG